MWTNKQRKRVLPDGMPKYVRVYDNGGESIDRYTVVFTGNYAGRNGECSYLGMSGQPFHPQGVGQHGSSRDIIDARQGWAPAIGRKCHLGKRIPFADLPEDCRKLVLRDYRELWGLPQSAETA
jgi:hypothetical protein